MTGRATHWSKSSLYLTSSGNSLISDWILCSAHGTVQSSFLQDGQFLSFMILMHCQGWLILHYKENTLLNHYPVLLTLYFAVFRYILHSWKNVNILKELAGLVVGESKIWMSLYSGNEIIFANLTYLQ